MTVSKSKKCFVNWKKFFFTVYERNVSLIQRNRFLGVQFFLFLNIKLKCYLRLQLCDYIFTETEISSWNFEKWIKVYWDRSVTPRKQFLCTEKKDLIESKKIICLNDFLWFKEMICLNEIKFVWFKQNSFEPNKYLLESNKFLP